MVIFSQNIPLSLHDLRKIQSFAQMESTQKSPERERIHSGLFSLSYAVHFTSQVSPESRSSRNVRAFFLPFTSSICPATASS